MYIRLYEVTGGESGMTWDAILGYLRDGTAHLKPATRKHYGNTGIRMLHHFGHYRLDEIEPTHCAQFLKWCRDEGRATTGNREKAFMSSVFEWAMAEGLVSRNPWRGIRRSRETPAREYVEHGQLTTQIDRAPAFLQALIGWAYLTGMRQTDCRLLQKASIKAGRVEWTESKTGKINSMPVTKTMQVFLDLAYAHAPASEFVFTSSRGLPWSEWGLQSALRRFGAGFKFRSLRRKAETDAHGTLGHTGQLAERYRSKRMLKAVK
jgi:integrase